MARPGPGVAAVCGGLAFFGVWKWVSEGRMKLNKYGDDSYISWAEDPALFGGLIFIMAAVGVACFVYAWRASR